MVANLIPMGLSIGGAIAGGVLGSNAAKKAKNDQLRAIAEARALQQQHFDRVSGMVQPDIEATSGVIPTLADLSGANGRVAAQRAYGNFQESPGYQFRLDTGTRAADRSAIGAGRANSGAAAAGLEQFAQGLASQEFGNHFGRLQNLAALRGQNVGTFANVSGQTAGNLGSLAMQGGNARAQGRINSTNAIIGGIQGVTDSLGYGAGRNSNFDLSGGGGSTFKPDFGRLF